MGPGDTKHPAAIQHILGEPFGSRGIANAAIEHIFDAWIAARHGVANNDHIRRGSQVFGIKALAKPNALLFKLRAHGGVDIGIAAADLES